MSGGRRTGTMMRRKRIRIQSGCRRIKCRRRRMSMKITLYVVYCTDTVQSVCGVGCSEQHV